MENWGPDCFVPSVCRKSQGGKVLLSEALDGDRMREALISRGLPLEVVKLNNLWYFRKKDNGGWSLIGESDDAENNFPVQWDISRLSAGRYEIAGVIRVTLAEGMDEASIDSTPTVRQVQIAR